MEGEVKFSCLARGILGGRGEVVGLEISQTHRFDESFQKVEFLCIITIMAF